MRTLVHLRHAEREPSGPHLTPRGARAAAELGRRWPRFDRVVASPKPRAVETAEAMGYRVARELPELAGLPPELERWVERSAPRTFAAYVAFAAEVGEAGDHAAELAAVLASELDRLADGARLLVVSHGGVVELASVGALGGATATWGAALAHLEGAELGREDGLWRGGRVVRSGR